MHPTKSIEQTHDPSTVIPTGWSIFKAFPLELSIGGMIELFSWSGAIFCFQLLFVSTNTIASVFMWTIGLIFTLLLFLIRCWVRFGHIQTQFALLNGQQPIFRSIHHSHLPKTFIKWRLLQFTLFLSAFLLASIPGGLLFLFAQWAESGIFTIFGYFLSVSLPLAALLFVNIVIFFGERLVVLSQYEPLEALKQSFSIAKRNKLSILIFILVANLFRFFSLFFFGVGIGFANIIIDMSLTQAFQKSRAEIETPVMP
jgi:hypothetical protein